MAEVPVADRELLKYASEHYGIDKICDYAAEITVNTKLTDNPARKDGEHGGPRGGQEPG